MATRAQRKDRVARAAGKRAQKKDRSAQHRPHRPRVVSRKRPTPAVAREAAPVNVAPAGSISEATTVITIGQLNEIQGRASAAETRAAQLEAELKTARAADPTGRIGSLTTVIRDGLLPIMRFAIANLPPLEIPKWPFKAVQAVALGLANLPDFSSDDDVLVRELELFATEIQEQELARSRKVEQLIADAPSVVPSKKTIVRIWSDGRCNCSAADTCPLGRTGSEERCTEAELRAGGLIVVPEGSVERHPVGE